MEEMVIPGILPVNEFQDPKVDQQYLKLTNPSQLKKCQDKKKKKKEASWKTEPITDILQLGL